MAKDIFHVYVHFPEKDVDKLVGSEQKTQELVNYIDILVNRIDCEKGATLYYQGDNKQTFVDELNTYGTFEEFGFLSFFNIEDTLNVLLNDVNAKNWEEKPKQDASGDCVYNLWYFDGQQVLGDFPEVLNEVTEHSLNTQEQEKCLLVSIKKALEITQKTLPTFKGGRDADNLPVFVYIAQVTDFKQLEAWFEENRRPRTYNMGDNRHIEGHGSYVPEKSPVLGGFGGKQNLADLLQTAVGDQHAKRDYEDLMNYDPLHKRYVWFEYEEDNPQNQYHGYHLAIPKDKAKYSGGRLNAHDRDTVAEARIPTRVKDILRQRLGDQFPD